LSENSSNDDLMGFTSFHPSYKATRLIIMQKIACKTKITLATIGHMPAELDKRKIKNWKSNIFSIEGQIESYSLQTDSDGLGWEFTDANLLRTLPETFGGNFLMAIVNVPMQPGRVGTAHQKII